MNGNEHQMINDCVKNPNGGWGPRDGTPPPTSPALARAPGPPILWGSVLHAGFGNNQVIDRSKRKELEKGVSLIGKSIHFELEKQLRNSESL